MMSQKLEQNHPKINFNSQHLALPGVVKSKSSLSDPHGDYHVGHQSCESKLAQGIGGWVGPSMLFSTPSPTQVGCEATQLLASWIF